MKRNLFIAFCALTLSIHQMHTMENLPKIAGTLVSIGGIAAGKLVYNKALKSRDDAGEILMHAENEARQSSLYEKYFPNQSDLTNDKVLELLQKKYSDEENALSLKATLAGGIIGLSGGSAALLISSLLNNKEISVIKPLIKFTLSGALIGTTQGLKSEGTYAIPFTSLFSYIAGWAFGAWGIIDMTNDTQELIMQ